MRPTTTDRLSARCRDIAGTTESTVRGRGSATPVRCRRRGAAGAAGILGRHASSVGSLICTLLLAASLVAFAPSDARAQQDDPVGPFVVDAHVAFPSFSSADSIAASYELRADQLPERGLGFELGAHVYPLRGRRVTLGLGATLLRARGRQKPAEDAPATDPTVESRISALTPQVSLNFGTQPRLELHQRRLRLDAAHDR